MGDDLQETENTLKISLMMLESRKYLAFPLSNRTGPPCIFEHFRDFQYIWSLPKGPKMNTGHWPVLRTFSKAPKKICTPQLLTKENLHFKPLRKVSHPYGSSVSIFKPLKSGVGKNFQTP